MLWRDWTSLTRYQRETLMVGFIERHPEEGWVPDFKAWVVDNAHIFDRFMREAIRVRSMGRSHYSARTIVEFLRHHTMVSEIDSDWKLNNSMVADLGRLANLILIEELRDFFEQRVQLVRHLRAVRAMA